MGGGRVGGGYPPPLPHPPPPWGVSRGSGFLGVPGLALCSLVGFDAQEEAVMQPDGCMDRRFVHCECQAGMVGLCTNSLAVSFVRPSL